MRVSEYNKKKRLGIPISLGKLSQDIKGIQQGTYYLIGGSSSSGKTTLADLCFFLDVLKSDKSVKVFYYSFEIGELRKTAKMLAHILYKKHNISLSNMDILNKTDVDIEPYRDRIEEVEDEYIAFTNNVTFRYVATNPTQIYKDLEDYAIKNGKYLYRYKKSDGTRYTSENKNSDDILIETSYTPNNPDELVIVVLDHLRRSKRERGFNVKENMDKLSEYAIEYRNMCNYSFVYLQQFNRNISNVDRQKMKGEDLIPNDADFSDSSNSYQDADTVITMFNPFKYGINRFANRNITKKHRILSILKNRDGEDNLSYIVEFDGKVNIIKDYVED